MRNCVREGVDDCHGAAHAHRRMARLPGSRPETPP